MVVCGSRPFRCRHHAQQQPQPVLVGVFNHGIIKIPLIPIRPLHLIPAHLHFDPVHTKLAPHRTHNFVWITNGGVAMHLHPITKLVARPRARRHDGFSGCLGNKTLLAPFAGRLITAAANLVLALIHLAPFLNNRRRKRSGGGWWRHGYFGLDGRRCRDGGLINGRFSPTRHQQHQQTPQQKAQFRLLHTHLINQWSVISTALITVYRLPFTNYRPPVTARSVSHAGQLPSLRIIAKPACGSELNVTKSTLNTIIMRTLPLPAAKLAASANHCAC